VQKLIIAIMLALVTLVGVCLPASAGSVPVLTDSPKELWVSLNGTNHAASKMANGASVSDISLTCQYCGSTYKLDIPRGTGVVVSPKGATVIDYVLLEVYISRDIATTISDCLLDGKSATLYKLVGGAWVKLQDF